MRALALVVLLGVGACSNEPRSSTHFADNKAERTSALEDCEAGAKRGAECPNAQQAEFLVRQKEKQRLAEDARKAYVNRSRDRH